MRFLRHLFIGLVLAGLLGTAVRMVWRSGALFSIPSFLSKTPMHFTMPDGGTVSAQDIAATPRDEAFSPDTNLQKVDLQLLRSSSSRHIDVAMYSFTDRALAEELVRKAESGVSIRIYRDNEQFYQELQRNPEVYEILKGVPNISIRVKGNRTLMHIKAWSDGNILREGSANWSYSGEIYQDNTLFVFKNPGDIHGFEAKFNEMWHRSTNIVVQ